MKRMNLPQAICALLGFVAVLLLPYYSFKFMGISYLNITAISSIGGMYPILLVPVLGMVVLAILGLTEFSFASLIAGAVMLVVQILFIVLKVQVLFSGDISFITQQLAGLLEKSTGFSTNIDVRMLLTPMVKPGLGFYGGISMNLIYLVLGLLPIGSSSSGSASSRGRRSFDGKNTGNRGGRSF